MTFHTATELLEHQLRELYGAELQMLAGLPQVIATARSLDLANLLAAHRLETEQHVVRLESCLSLLTISVHFNSCRSMRGLLEEVMADASREGKETVRDAALGANCLRLSQFKVAMYTNARNLADALDLTMVLRMLDASLSEERAFDVAMWDLGQENLTPRAMGLESASSSGPHLVLVHARRTAPRPELTSLPSLSLQ